MEITFNLPHVFEGASDSQSESYVLRALLDAQTKINLAYLRDHAVKSLYSSGVVYGRTKLWEPIPAVIMRGYGDCKSLAPWLVAQYLSTGLDARCVHRWVRRPDGLKDFHVLVQTRNGYEDPSRVLGMGANENAPHTE